MAGIAFPTGSILGGLGREPGLARRLYGANFGSDNVSGFTIGADGALTPVEEHGRRPAGNTAS